MRVLSVAPGDSAVPEECFNKVGVEANAPSWTGVLLNEGQCV